MRESEERYRGVVEAQSDLVSRYLPDSTLIFANQAFCSFFGSSREQLIGRKLTDLLPPEARGKIEESIKPIHSRRQPFVWEYALRGADGNLHWHQWISCHVITNGAGNVAHTGLGRDITSRKQAEDATRKLAHVTPRHYYWRTDGNHRARSKPAIERILTNIASGEKLLRQKSPPIDELLAVFSDIRHDNARAVDAVSAFALFEEERNGKTRRAPQYLD